MTRRRKGSRAPVPRRRPQPKTRARSGASRRRNSPYPLLEAAEVLSSIVAFSREVSADMGEEQLFELFHRTLRELLPNRLVAVRRIDPRTLRVAHILAEDDLVPNAEELPPAGPEDAENGELRLIFKKGVAG